MLHWSVDSSRTRLSDRVQREPDTLQLLALRDRPCSFSPVLVNKVGGGNEGESGDSRRIEADESVGQEAKGQEEMCQNGPPLPLTSLR
jgi:hypothetical protein